MTVFLNSQFKEPATQSIVSSIGFECIKNDYSERIISIRYEGYLKILKDDIYCFKIFSDDDSLFKLNDKNIIINPSMASSINKVLLKSGYYKLYLDYVNKIGSACLTLQWSSGCREYESIPTKLLFY